MCAYTHTQKSLKVFEFIVHSKSSSFFFPVISPINKYIFYIRNPKSMTDHAHPYQSLSVPTPPSCSPSQLGMAQLVPMSEASIS